MSRRRSARPSNRQILAVVAIILALLALTGLWGVPLLRHAADGCVCRPPTRMLQCRNLSNAIYPYHRMSIRMLSRSGHGDR